MAVRALLDKGADVSAAQGDGMTALHWAAMSGDLELAQMLVHAGANLKAATRIAAATPLLLAAENGHAASFARCSRRVLTRRRPTRAAPLR